MASKDDVEIRKPPVGAVYAQHKQGVRGLCGWCGLAVTETTPARGWLKFWHDACDVERSIIEQPAMARHYVFKRDRGVCCDCGKDWSQMFRLLPEYRTSMGAREIRVVYVEQPDDDRFAKRITTWGQQHDGFAWVPLRKVSLWHVDHKVPLWKVRFLDALKRLEFFKLANLITRCIHCHQRKSKAEEAEKAHLDRLASKPDRDRPPKPKRRWPSRPFQKRIKP